MLAFDSPPQDAPSIHQTEQLMKQFTLVALVLALVALLLPSPAFAENLYGGQVPKGPCEQVSNPCGTGPVDCSDSDPDTWNACVNAHAFPFGNCKAETGSCSYDEAEPCAFYRVCSNRVARPGGGWICANCSDLGNCEMEGCNYNL